MVIPITQLLGDKDRRTEIWSFSSYYIKEEPQIQEKNTPTLKE